MLARHAKQGAVEVVKYLCQRRTLGSEILSLRQRGVDIRLDTAPMAEKLGEVRDKSASRAFGPYFVFGVVF